MGNSLKKNIELVLLGCNRFNHRKKVKNINNFTIYNENIINALKYFNAIKDEHVDIINNKDKFDKLVTQSYEVLELKQKINKYLKENSLDIKNVSFEKINKDLNLGKTKEYSLYRAYLYKKYYIDSKSFNCNSNIDFKNILKNKLFIFEKDGSSDSSENKYTKKELCQMLGKNTYKEGLEILKYIPNEETIEETIESKNKKKKSKQIENKLCGPRNSQKNPAYTRDELIKILKKNSDSLKINKNLITKMTKKQMCQFLPKLNINIEPSILEDNIEDKELDKELENLLKEVEQKGRKKSKTEYSKDELNSLISSKKKCGPMNSQKNPAYTRDEILNIVMPHLQEYNLSKTKVMKMTKTELCYYVEKIKGIKPIIEEEEEKEEKEKEEEINKNKKEIIQENDDITLKNLEKKIEEERKINRQLIPKSKKENGNGKGTECYTPINKKVELKEHQIRVAKHMLTHRGLLAIHGTGTGKTLTAVASINCILNNFPDMNIVIITPTSLISNFKKELGKFGLDIENSSIKNKINFSSFKQFVIDVHSKQKNFNMCKNNFIIIDEAHNLRNLGKREKIKPGEVPKGLTAATILQCIKSASKVLLLTATPILNRISDIDVLIAMVDGTDIQPLPKNYSLDNLEIKFKCKISINPGNKTSVDFPLRIDVPIEETIFTMNDNYYQRYYNIQSEKGAEFSNKFKSNRFLNAVRRAALSLDDENSPKVKWTFDKVKEENSQGRKSVIYTAWKESGVYHVRRLLDKNKISYGIYSGDMTKNQKDATRDAYNNNKIKILIITRAGGEGLDLKGTNNIILMEPNWNKETDEQIIGRGIRYKSHSHLPENLRYTKVYKLYMFKPKEVYADDLLESADEILYEMSYYKKDPIIKSFINSIEPFSIENNNCDKCCKIKKTFPSINDEEFFNYYKWNSKMKLDENEDEDENKEKKHYKAPDNITYMFGHKEKKSKSKLSKSSNSSKPVSKLSKLYDKFKKNNK
jgi:superfamily II DNA or RNA helicase